MFARLRLQRLADSLSSRYVVVEREVLHRSPVILTPYAAGDTIDAAALQAQIGRWYADAGLARADVDTGAVIFTGAAIERHNARQLADLFADEGGTFVCASAGHALEATLAAHGSGSVARSRREGSAILHVDVGGGTTKLARIENGTIIATSAFAVGARLVAFDDHGAIARVEPAARSFGVSLVIGARLTGEQRERMAAAMADLIVTAIRGGDVPMASVLLGPPKRSAAPTRITLSGGVSAYMSGLERQDHGDLGQELAAALLARRDRLPAPLEIVPDGIRATVIGASQFTVQVSGNTIGIGAALPLRNVPVVSFGSDDDGSGPLALAIKGSDARASGPLALAIKWSGEPEHARIRALAERIAAATDRRPLVVATDGDIAATLGAILRHELAFEGELITLDGLDLGELDYIDIGAPQAPSGVVPVIVKSLVFHSRNA